VNKTLLAEFTARQGAEDKVARLLLDYAQKVRREEGNLAFDVYTKASKLGGSGLARARHYECAFDRET
jgi:quinol monooxygenase YgiN